MIAEVDWIDEAKDKSFAVTCYGPDGVSFDDVTDS